MSVSAYFPHYANARNDEKILEVRMKYGMEGYGIYFAILERLRDTEDYTSVTNYNVIAFDLRVDASKVKSIVEDFGLFVFTENGEYFYSERFLNHMDYKDDISKKRAEAGRKGGLKKAENQQNKEVDKQTSSKNLANAKQMPSNPLAVNETKRNETKQNKTKQNINTCAPARESAEKETVTSVIKEFAGEDTALLEALNGFKDMRLANKSKLTVRAMKLALTELKKLSLSPAEQVKIIDQSTVKGWKGFFPLKNNNQSKGIGQSYNDKVDEWARNASLGGGFGGY